MRKKHQYYVYILTNKPKGTLYIGVTNDIIKRTMQHHEGSGKSFSARYKLRKLVYVEPTHSIEEAIKREKQLKNWHRDWKINLIESANPEWEDLYETCI